MGHSNVTSDEGEYSKEQATSWSFGVAERGAQFEAGVTADQETGHIMATVWTEQAQLSVCAPRPIPRAPQDRAPSHVGLYVASSRLSNRRNLLISRQ